MRARKSPATTVPQGQFDAFRMFVAVAATTGKSLVYNGVKNG
jgi:hypothetical protein